MKNLILFFLLILTFNNLNAQSPPSFGTPKDSANFEVNINPDYFLLGTFSDYWGRFHYIDRETQIDRYYPYEESLANYVNNFIYKNYSSKRDLKFKESRHSELFNPTLAKQLHSEYFDVKGNFIDEKLDTDEKKYSFLLGTYLRYGNQVTDNIYKIQIYNSPKDKQIYQILKDLESDKIIYKLYRDNIPSSEVFYFVATPKMIKYFKTLEKENIEINQKKEEFSKLKTDDKLAEKLKKQIEVNEENFIKCLKTLLE